MRHRKPIKSRNPTYTDICNIIADAFHKDMEENDRNYTVKIMPKGNGKLEVTVDI